MLICVNFSDRRRSATVALVILDDVYVSCPNLTRQSFCFPTLKTATRETRVQFVATLNKAEGGATALGTKWKDAWGSFSVGRSLRAARHAVMSVTALEPNIST